MKQKAIVCILIMFFLSGFNFNLIDSKNVNKELINQIRKNVLNASNLEIVDIKSIRGLNLVLYTCKINKENYIGCSYFTNEDNKILLSKSGTINKIIENNPINSYSMGIFNINDTEAPTIVYGNAKSENIKTIKVDFADSSYILSNLKNKCFFVIKFANKAPVPVNCYALDKNKKIISTNPVLLDKVNISDIKSVKILKPNGTKIIGYVLNFDLNSPYDKKFIKDFLDLITLGNSSRKNRTPAASSGGDYNTYLILELKNGDSIDLGVESFVNSKNIYIDYNKKGIYFSEISPKLHDMILSYHIEDGKFTTFDKRNN
jgi:hypothetical protein